MPIIIPDCSSVIPFYECAPCDPREFARVRQVALIDSAYTFTDKEDDTEWETAVQAKEIILFHETRGEVTEPSPLEVQGYGDVKTELASFDQSIVFYVPYYVQNCDLFNALNKAKNYKAMYKTQTKGHFTDVAVAITAVPVIPDDTGTPVEWKVTLKWTSLIIPCPEDIASLSCFNVTP